MLEPRLREVIPPPPYPLLFLTVSGAHLYGFPSPDSDYDLRGVHVINVSEVLGLAPLRETVTALVDREGLRLDIVTHDVRKFCSLLLKRNGYVLEQLFSPLVVSTTSAHAELKSVARRCVTRGHADHYLGFAETQWRLCVKESPPRVKLLLYTFRVLLTGIHLMRTGDVEANLERLNAQAKLPYVSELIAQKTTLGERAVLASGDIGFYEREYLGLRQALQDAQKDTTLPDRPLGRAEVNDLLVRVRLHSLEVSDAPRHS